MFVMALHGMKKADFYTSLVLLVFSAAIVFMSLNMPSLAGRDESKWSNPGVVPTFIGVVLFALSFAMLVRSFVKKDADQYSESAGNVQSNPPAPAVSAPAISKASLSRIGVTVLLCLGYVFLLGKLWFPLATFLFVFMFIVAFEFSREKPMLSQWKMLIVASIIAVLASASVTAVFQYLFLVNLP